MPTRRSLVLGAALLHIASCAKGPSPTTSPTSEQPDTLPRHGDTDEDDELRRVCTKLAQLVVAEPGLPEASKAKARDIESCVADGRTDRLADPEKFALQRDCILEASAIVPAMECLFRVSDEAGTTPSRTGASG